MAVSFFQACAFNADAIGVLSDAFEAALRLANIGDRKDPRAEGIASRIIMVFEAGERDPTKIARRVTAN